MLKRMKWMSLIMALLYILFGIVLLLYPGQMADMICDLFGVALVAYGIINIVTYFMIDIRESLYRNDFAAGVIKILVGVMVIYYKETFQELMPFLLGLAIITSGVYKLQDGIDAARIGYSQGWLYILMAAVSIVLGFVIMFNIVQAKDVMLQAAGASLVYCGVTDLYSTLYLSGKIDKFMREVEQRVTEKKETFVQQLEKDAMPKEKEEEEPPVSEPETPVRPSVDWSSSALDKDEDETEE
ncbi:MAG: DUF308 domain-containing protein [Solobacterium sp.]|nr:DUF308 domain-containing protein [Solobacterium sp.]